MQIILSILLVVHGAIHLLGFMKAFNTAKVPQLKQPISKTAGVFWLIAFLIFMYVGIRIAGGLMCWYLLAAFAILISTVLIILAWKDAKFGLIPNLIIALAAYISFASCAFEKRISHETQKVLNVENVNQNNITAAQLDNLPAPVKTWLQKSGIVGRPAIKTLYSEQKLKLKLMPEQSDWYSGESRQFVSTRKPAFVWTINLNMNPVVKVRGRDKYMDGHGEMRIRLFSAFDLVNETGQKLDEGTMQRYLGEIVWYPSAALEPYISWEAIDDRSARATMTYGDLSASGIFIFGNDGLPVGFSCMRFMENTPDAERFLWKIQITDYDTFDGITVPSAMNASWELETGQWQWLNMKVDKIEYNPTEMSFGNAS